MASPALDPVAIINAAAIGINALLSIITNLKAQSGLTDEEIAARFAQHGAETQAFISDLLAKLPPVVTANPPTTGPITPA